LIADSILPALEAQAAAEAVCNFAGTYNPTIPGLNSSLTLAIDQSVTSPPGIIVSSWISNGTDMITRLAALGSTPWRLVPSISDSKNKKAAFWLVTATDAPSSLPPTELFAKFDQQDWFEVGSLSYGDLRVFSFVFDVGADGKATAATLPAFRVTLRKGT